MFSTQPRPNLNTNTTQTQPTLTFLVFHYVQFHLLKVELCKFLIKNFNINLYSNTNLNPYLNRNLEPKPPLRQCGILYLRVIPSPIYFHHMQEHLTSSEACLSVTSIEEMLTSPRLSPTLASQRGMFYKMTASPKNNQSPFLQQVRKYQSKEQSGSQSKGVMNLDPLSH